MKKILIIEDDSVIRESIAEYFRENGYAVSTAHNGVVGIQLAIVKRPDLIICDISMPEMNGYQVKEDLSKIIYYEAIPFIYLTAHKDFDTMRKAMELGADDYIVKPVNVKKLLEIVEKRLERIEQLKTGHDFLKKKDEPEEKSVEKILLKNNDKQRLVSFRDIVVVEASDYNTVVHLKDGEKYSLKKSLNTWEEKLPEHDFIRVHRGFIINCEKIKTIDKWFKGTYKISLYDYPEPIYSSQRYSVIMRKRFNL